MHLLFEHGAFQVSVQVGELKGRKDQLLTDSPPVSAEGNSLGMSPPPPLRTTPSAHPYHSPLAFLTPEQTWRRPSIYSVWKVVFLGIICPCMHNSRLPVMKGVLQDLEVVWLQS